MYDTEIEQQIHYGNLLNIYGSFLTEKQQEYMKLYYEEDFSLAEIAEKYDVSRASVHKQIQVSCQKMNTYEEELKVSFLQQEAIPALFQAFSKKDDEEIENILIKIKEKIDWSE